VLNLPTVAFPSSLTELIESDILRRTIFAMLWIWLVMLQFTLHNQRRPESIIEDSINKPWRPLPSGRISVKGVNCLLFVTYLATSVLSFQIGVISHFIVFTGLVYWYNDLGGSDRSGLFRNFLNASGYACLFSAPLRISLDPSEELKIGDRATLWTLIMVLVIFTTIHAQEFRDEAGDKARGRQNIITSIGHTWARLLLVVFMTFWCTFIPMWLGLTYKGAFVTWALGLWTAVLTIRGMVKRTEELDKNMYLLWSCWLFSCTPLPLVKAIGG
jgi:4-hydroxybenzoate polyprenyltransferase